MDAEHGPHQARDAFDLELGRRWRAERARALLTELWGDGLPCGDDPVGTFLVDAIAADDLTGSNDDLVVQGDGLTLSALARILDVFPAGVVRGLVPAELLRKLPPPPVPQVRGPGAWEWRIDTDEFAWDEACARLLHTGVHAGGSPARALLEGRIHPDDHAGIAAGLDATARTGAPYRMDFRVLGEDPGAEEWLTATGRLIDFPVDQPARVIGFVVRYVGQPVAAR